MPDVTIVVRSEDRTGPIKSANTKLEDMKKQLVAVAAAAATFKKAFDFSREGAEFIQTGESFDLLLEKVGAAPDLLQQLQDASKGTISEMKLMSGTATLLAGVQGELATEMANASPKMLEIAKAANKLNPALGSVAFQYQSLMTGIKRGSKLIIDNTGLTVDLGLANADYAASIGKTVKQLDENEKRLALLYATQKAGLVLIDQVGGSTDSMTDSWDRFTAKTEDATNKWKALLAEGLLPYLEIMAGGGLNIHDALERHVDDLVHSTDAYGEYVTQVKLAATRTGDYNRRTQELDKSIQLLTETQWEEARAEQWLVDTADARIDDRLRMIDWTDRATLSAEQYAEAIKDDRRRMIDWGPVIEATNAELEAMEEATRAAELEQERFNEELERAAALTGDYFTKAIEAGETTESWAQQFYDAADAAEADAYELALLAGAVGLYDDEQIAAALNTAILHEKIAELAEQYAAGEISIEQATSDLIFFKEALDRVPPSKTVTITTEYKTIGQRPTWDPTVLIERPGLQHGAWDVPFTGPRVIHEHEMVIPAGPAEAIRRGRGGSSVRIDNLNVYASDVSPHALTGAIRGGLGGLEIGP